MAGPVRHRPERPRRSAGAQRGGGRGYAQAVYADLAPTRTHHLALPSATALLQLAPALIAAGLRPASQALPLYIRDKVAQTTAERHARTAGAAGA